tara:strand:- start:2290 stop:3570 length:1281 start_codon:yes stop_codon:yes gene_type:complete
MGKLIASIKKEFLLLTSDKIGLLLMYLMPVFLVFVITIVQDSTFKLVNENSIEILVVNNDQGTLGNDLIEILQQSGSFKITELERLRKEEIKQYLLNDSQLLAIDIPEKFTDEVTKKAEGISREMLEEFGVLDSGTNVQEEQEISPLNIYYDPILQENFRLSIVNSIYSFLGALENKLMIEKLYNEMGYENIPESFEANFTKNRVEINQISANNSSNEAIPNSTQHNVPAWSIFAMFFMVISLGGNIVKERLNGSFVRLQTIPSSFLMVLVGKVFIYLIVALSQLTFIFLLGKYFFPTIGLPSLSLPSNLVGLVVISILSGLAAISFAMLVGTYAKTVEQASGFGAITIIIFAAIGGIWVPSFVMPEYLQNIGKISPLHWSLEGFYTLFLRGGEWNLLFPSILFLIFFIFACQILIYLKLKIQNYI